MCACCSRGMEGSRHMVLVPGMLPVVSNEVGIHVSVI